MNEPTTTFRPAADAARVEAEAVDLAGVCRMLDIGETTGKQWLRDRRLPEPVLRIGRVCRWSKREVQAWLLAGAPNAARWSGMREASMRRLAP